MRTKITLFMIVLTVIMVSSAIATVFDPAKQVISMPEPGQGRDVGWWDDGDYVVPLMIGGVVSGKSVAEWAVGVYDSQKLAGMTTQLIRAGTFAGSAALAGAIVYFGWQYIDEVLSKEVPGGGYVVAEGALGVGHMTWMQNNGKTTIATIVASSNQCSAVVNPDQGYVCNCAYLNPPLVGSPYGGWSSSYWSDGDRCCFSATQARVCVVPKAGYETYVTASVTYEPVTDEDITTAANQAIIDEVTHVIELVRDGMSAVARVITEANKHFPAPPVGGVSDGRGNTLTGTQQDAIQTAVNAGVDDGPGETAGPVADKPVSGADIQAAIEAAIAGSGISKEAKQILPSEVRSAVAGALEDVGIVPGIYITPGQVQAAVSGALESLVIPEGVTAQDMQAAMTAALTEAGLVDLVIPSPADIAGAVEDGIDAAISGTPAGIDPISPGEVDEPDKLSLSAVLDDFWDVLTGLPVLSLLTSLQIQAEGSPTINVSMPGFFGRESEQMTLSFGEDTLMGINYATILSMLGNLMLAWCGIQWTKYLFEG